MAELLGGGIPRHLTGGEAGTATSGSETTNRDEGEGHERRNHRRNGPERVRAACPAGAPDSPLTRAVQDAATRILPATLLNGKLR